MFNSNKKIIETYEFPLYKLLKGSIPAHVTNRLLRYSRSKKKKKGKPQTVSAETHRINKTNGCN